MQIFDGESSEISEEIFLTDRLCGVVTELGTELHVDSEKISNGMVSKRIVELPTAQ